MKGALTAVISALALGVLSAAEVSGSNSAIVVEKDVRESSTGWQLLCVPVNGFSVDNATTGTIDVNDFLPASYYNSGSVVYTVDESGNSTEACTLGDSGWTGDVTEFSGGQTIWLKKKATSTASSVMALALAGLSASTTSESSSDTIYFCGQARDLTPIDRPDAGTIALRKNDSAAGIALKSLVESPQAGDTILTVQNGKKNYLYYTFNGTVWMRNSAPRTDSSDVEILPGEAFYYQSIASEN